MNQGLGSRKIVCTQQIVHTMLKESEIPVFSARRSHRTYSPQFKAELVAACQVPGVSIAALAGRHGMNVNVLHRWLREYERHGSHRLATDALPSIAPTTAPVAAFVPLALPTAKTPATEVQQVKIELHKGALSMILTWPVGAAADLAAWTGAVLK